MAKKPIPEDSTLDKDAYFEGVVVDLRFRGVGTCFGDLIRICGYENPNFPPVGEFDFAPFADTLHFSQVDDYFGVRSLTDEGDDVVVWLYPLVEGQPVDHHAGPYDGLRLQYCVLRQPLRRAAHFLLVVKELASNFPVEVYYYTRDLTLELGEALRQIEADIQSIDGYWRSRRIVPGSGQALEISF